MSVFCQTVKVMSLCNLESQPLPELMNKNAKFNGEQENKSFIFVRMGLVAREPVYGECDQVCSNQPAQ